MSRSTQPLKELSDGWHLVAITEVKNENGILITFADGTNKKHQELYEVNSNFVKMCGDAGLITDESVFDSKKAIGTRLQIGVSDKKIIKTKEYNKHIPLESVKSETIAEECGFRTKLKIIAEQRAMIKKIESGESNEFDM